MAARDNRFFHYLFRIGIALKFMNGALEILGGLLLLIVNTSMLSAFVATYLSPELFEDPNDFIANALLHGIQSLSVEVRLLFILYLLVQGTIKVGIVIALWKQRRWAYPLAAILLGLFTVYQFYLIIHLRSVWLLVLTLIDIIILLLLRFEYLRIKPMIKSQGKGAKGKRAISSII